MRSERKTISVILPAAYGTGGIDVLYEYGSRMKKYGCDTVFYVPLIAYNLHRGNCFVDFAKQIYASLKMLKDYYINKRFDLIEKEKNIEIKLIPVIKDKYIKKADAIIASAWVTAYDVAKLSKDKGDKWYFIQDYEIWDNQVKGVNSYRLPLKKIVIAKWIKEKLIEECKCKEEEIHIVRNGIDTMKFTKSGNEETTECLECLMLDHELKKKGVSNGVKAFEEAKRTIKNLHLSMFGVKKSANVPAWADFYENPSHEELLSLYRKADIFIFPSLEEGWGLTPLEAMACGCAVAGTNVGCMRELGVNGENALISEPNDISEMSKNICLFANKEFRQKISEEGWKTVQMLDWESSTQKLINILFSV